jgi:metal-responsive CopG/Arc/MetJ family transcriptional regulator
MASQTFNLSLPKELVKKVDAHAKKDYSTRSDFIRKAVINQLKSEAAEVDDAAVIRSAKKILKDYHSDFEALSQR